MLRPILIITLSLLTGCGPELENFSCSQEQLAQVKEEVSVCSSSGFRKSYCFEQAKKTLCDPVSKKK